MGDRLNDFPDWPPIYWVGAATIAGVLIGLIGAMILSRRWREVPRPALYAYGFLGGAFWGGVIGLVVGLVLLMGWGVGESNSSRDSAASDYDLDCDDVAHESFVAGDDPFELDADGDGIACDGKTSLSHDYVIEESLGQSYKP